MSAPMSHDRENWLRVAKERDEIKAERDQLRVDRYYNRKCINRLASATGTLGEKSEKVVEVALSTIDQLRAEAAQTVALANWNGVLERALKAEAERDHLHAQLRALTLICGTNDANKFETWIDRANARAEKAEAQLATERARVKKLSEASNAQLSLICGELTARELRTIRAVLGFILRNPEKNIEEVNEN